jgi:hypothetical protein
LRAAYQLALLLGRQSGRQVLRELTEQEFMEWQAFLELEPPIDARMKYYFASIRQTIANSKRDPTKRPTPYKVDDFLLKFGDEGQQLVTRSQSWQEQKAMFFAYAREFQRSRRVERERRERVQRKITIKRKS